MGKIIILVVAIFLLQLSAEVKADGYLAVSELPHAEKFLPPPPDTTGQRFVGDWLMYQWGKATRNSTRGHDATTDASVSGYILCKIFTPAFGMTLSSSKTPQIYRLLNTVRQDATNATQTAKAKFPRRRPYDQFNESTLIAANESSSKSKSSYVSEHAAIGWATALILAEINIDRQDTILSRGYQFGECRVIAGYNYESDVEAGRVVGMTTVARLHANEAFMEQLEKAKAEYLQMTGLSKVYAPQAASSGIYNMEGVKVDETQLEKGSVYIQDGQKKIAR